TSSTSASSAPDCLRLPVTLHHRIHRWPVAVPRQICQSPCVPQALFCAAAYCRLANKASMYRLVHSLGRKSKKPRNFTGKCDLFATPEQRSVPFGAAQKGKEDQE